MSHDSPDGRRRYRSQGALALALVVALVLTVSAVFSLYLLADGNDGPLPGDPPTQRAP